uniref:Uncharacterized protein n=1 Tax=Rhizophagus irregularis (strain DAOM 181602 / DAOM 197198 / MUCL 43194) TaxID=747089 RepID=U9UFI3_RHIID
MFANPNSDVKAFPLLCGWALKHNQKYGKKGSEKRIAPQVIALLERFFLEGNTAWTHRISVRNQPWFFIFLVKSGRVG